jgi:hypothetical protein
LLVNHLTAPLHLPRQESIFMTTLFRGSIGRG